MPQNQDAGGNSEVPNVNGNTLHPEEINVDDVSSLGAIAVNYDGQSASDDNWASGATVVIDSNSYDGASGSNSTDRAWNVSPCKGDMNSDHSVDASDGSPSTMGSPYYDAFHDPTNYRSDFPGLEGSRVWHGDCNFLGGFTADDDPAFNRLVSEGCCLIDLVTTCPSDLNNDLIIDINDLAILLANFGTTSGATREDGDIDDDGDVDIADLAFMLSEYATVCCPEEGEAPSGDIEISIEPYDSNYTGGGFYGEDEHFVFDIFVEVDEGADDWTTAAVCLERDNGATFRLVDDPGDPPSPVPGSTEPEKYSTFFSVPKGVNASSRFNTPFPDGGIAGSCHPLSGAAVYTTTEIHACWIDWDTASSDGPDAIMRIVIDVSGVSGADTSGGFGSVYFSTTGPSNVGDIKVADIEVNLTHQYDEADPTDLSGEFYVIGP